MALPRVNEIFARVNERRRVNEFSVALFFVLLVLVLLPKIYQQL